MGSGNIADLSTSPCVALRWLSLRDVVLMALQLVSMLNFKTRLPGTSLAYLPKTPSGSACKLDAPRASRPSLTALSGILGYGAVGRQVARVFKAIGMDVHACTLRRRETAASRRDDSYAPPGCGDPEGIFPSRWFSADTEEELHSFLGSGLDVLVLTIPLTAKTRGMIGRKEFGLLAERKTFVSNVARGEVVDTDALMDALEADVICGAALDVTDPEPLPDGHPLWTTKNVVITPHVSGDTTSYARGVFEVLKGNLTRLSKGQELSNRVNLAQGY